MLKSLVQLFFLGFEMILKLGKFKKLFVQVEENEAIIYFQKQKRTLI